MLSIEVIRNRKRGDKDMKVLKWVGIVVGILIVLIIVALLVVPRFVDINEYKPKIESMVSESTGRSFSIGGDIDLTLFPWAGVSLSDMHLGNAKGFKEKDFVSVEHFEVRVKLLPLIFKDVRVRRFLVKGPKIALEKDNAGRGNWEDLAKPEREEKAEKTPAPDEALSLPIKNLVVGEFAITSGELIWIDHQKGTEQRLTEINVGLDSIAPDQPIGLDLSARLNGQPIEVKGEVGPLGRPIGEGKVPILVTVTALDALVAKLQGFLADLRKEPRFSMEMEVEPFSPRKVAEAVGADLSETITNPEALKEMSLKTNIAGTSKAVTLQDGLLKFDDSTLTFHLDAKQFERPVLAFTLNVDRIDIDRYLPPSAKGKEEEKPAPAPERKPADKPDYTALRKLVMDGTVRVGELKARGATLSDVMLKIKAKDGIILVDPFSMKLYEGALSGKVALNVQQDTPKIKTTQRLENVQAGPLLNDLGYTDKLEGLVNFEADISVEGTEPEEIKKTLNGSGEFAFTDGAIVGFDIAQMVRNVTAALGLGEKKKPRTEFSELKGSFTVKNGVIDNPNTYLGSPLLRVMGKGTLDLPKETIDYRVDPKFVGTLKGQGATGEKPGLMIPVVISGTFSNPKFRADLSGVVGSEALKEEASKLLEGLTKGEEDDATAVTESLKILQGVTTGEEGTQGGLEELVPGLFPKKEKK
jgi:AsmA protein